MSDHVLLNLLNKLRKRDNMRGLASISSLFCNEFHKFNNSGAQMLDCVYHYPHTFLKKRRGYCNRLHPSVRPSDVHLSIMLSPP